MPGGYLLLHRNKWDQNILGGIIQVYLMSKRYVSKHLWTHHHAPEPS
jgi:hypothetical protein